MRILFVSSECAPFATTGGLSDISASLPDALNQSGHEVDRILPFYKSAALPIFKAKATSHLFSLQMEEQVEEGSLWKSSFGQTPTYFVRHDAYFHRDGLYGDQHGEFGDNERRYCFFQKAALDFILTQERPYDIIHLNDWQTGLLPFLIKDTLGEGAPKTLFTIHNLAYQGSYDFSMFPLTGLTAERRGIEGVEFYGRVNFMKAGLQGADYLSTVSARYAEEIQTSEFGCGMEGLLRYRSGQLKGIVNGVDYSVWNPAVDPHIPTPFSVENLAGKKACKKALLKALHLRFKKNVLTLGMVCRITDQKGFDILADAIKPMMDFNIQLIILGSGESKYENLALDWQTRWPEKVRVEIGFNVGRAHEIEAGVDAFLMPSKFEPCGLNQLYSLKYGTLPIVSPVGGLYDTVKDISRDKACGTGFVMEAVHAEAFVEQIRYAVALYADQDLWTAAVLRAMKEDWSWTQSVLEYEAMYDLMLS